MIPYLSLRNQPDVNLYRAKIRLNNEFNEKARLPNLVGILYYPTQAHYVPLPHAKLEIEGKCYILCGNRKDKKSLEKKIASALHGNLSFARIGISVTPNQLKELKKNKKFINSATCSQGVVDALNKHADFRIPRPLSFGPTLSTCYLTLAKTAGCSRITSIDYYSHYNNITDKVFKIAYPILGLGLEIGALVAPVAFSAWVYAEVSSMRIVWV